MPVDSSDSMKHLCWFVLLCWSMPLYAQPMFRLDSLPVQGTVLNEGWRWQPGDNPAWATPAFDDRHWQAIDPSQDITTLSQIQHTRIGWLRLHLRVDCALLGKIISMLIDQQVASQIYLNGRLIGGFGRVSTNPDSVEAYNPSGISLALWQTTHFQLGAQAHQLLAVRFALQPNVHYVRFSQNPCPFLLIKLHQADQRNQYRVDSLGNFDNTYLDYFKAGLFIILALLHVLFYVWYPLQRVNLWFGLYCLFSTCAYLITAIGTQYVHNVTTRASLSVIVWTLLFTAQPVFLLAVYNLATKRISVFINITLIAFGISMLLYILQIDLFFNITLFLELLLYIESARQLLLMGRKPGSEYRILFIGALLFSGFLTAFVITPFLGFTALTRQILVHLFYNVSSISLPISITLFLASRFSQTYRLLGERLAQVEALSARTLAQEQEKQHLLASQNETLEREVNARTVELSQSLTELKNTQNQLIQKEKMASLGELTAGIAHEIQNPLNFVNNFSEVSTEVLTELQEAIQSQQADQVNELTGELNQNLLKINYHGKRAATIIQGMLAHARTSTDERRLTDLNALAIEHLNLAYQGYRSAHPQFDCQLVTELDATLGQVSVQPQELGRVLLNLYSNSFYALAQKQRTNQPHETESGYRSTLWVRSRQVSKLVELQVEDNGVGIATSLQAKIFQPFFTTKPTGQGTGLGLSLSYDIVTKGHGGHLLVKSQPNHGATFIIQLPL